MNKSSIVFCSKSFEQIYGGEAHSYLGTDLNSLMPPSLQHNSTLIESIFSNGEDNKISILKRVLSTFGYHKEGYLVPVEATMDIFPIMTQGLFIMVAIRQVPLMNKDFILIRENGDIECATKRVTEKLGLKNSNIRSLSEELYEAHLVFNKVGLLDDKELAVLITQKEQKEQNETNPSIRRGTKKLSVIPQRSKYHRTEEEETKEIFNIFSTEGKALQLNGKQKKIAYHCSIQNYLFPSAKTKIITLTENSLYHNGDPETPRQVKKTRNRTSFEMTKGGESLRVAEADTMVDDEKQDGWIEFDRIRSSVTPRFSTREAPDSALLKKYGNIVSTTMGEELITSRTSRRFSSLSPHLKPIESKSLHEDDIDLSSSHENEFEEFEGEVRELTLPFGKALSIASSQVSRTSHKKNILDAFTAAVTAKSYSRSWVLLILLFYLGVISVFAIQLGLVLTLEKNFSNFQLKKDLLKAEQMRRYYLLLTHSQIRTSIDVVSGTIQVTEYGLISLLVAAMVPLNVWTGSLDLFVESNHEVFKNSTGLESYIRESVFAKNIKHYEYENPESVIKVDSFESADLFAEAILGISKLLTAGKGAEALDRFIVAAQNSLNDLFINIENNLELFLDSVHKQRENIDFIVQGFLIAILVWLGCVVVSFSAFLRKLYLSEQQNLLAITKLDGKVLNVTLENMKAFHAKIVMKRFDEKSKGKAKDFHQQKSYNKTAVFTGVRNKYLVYLPKFLPFLITTIAFIAGNSIVVHKSLDKLQLIQEVINQSMDTICIITTAFISAEEMLMANDTSLIKNHAPSIELSIQIEAIDSAKSNLLDFLSQNNHDLVNTEIMNIFLSEGCHYAPELAFLCQLIDLFGQKTGVINLLNYIQGILAAKLQKFNRPNNSAQDLREIFLQNIDILTTATSVATSEITLVTNMLSKNFEETMDEAKKNRDLIFTFFSLTLVVQGFYIWFKVLGKLREAENQFKNVLETLPAHVVLANFLLKSFLIQTSQGVLDASIKNSLG